MRDLPTIVWVALVSELVAVYLIWNVWRSKDFTLMKFALSGIALVPIVGPVIVLWIANFPSPAPVALQDRGPSRRGKYYSRWSAVIGAKSPIRRFRLWQGEIKRNLDDDP